MAIKLFSHKKPKKIGFVLSGGFLGGSFQAGALKALEDLGIKADYVVGASVGAINGSMYVVGKINTLISIWQNLHRNHIYTFRPKALLKAFVFSDSICSNEPLKKLIEEHADHDAFISSSVRCDIIATNVTLGKETIFSNRHKRIMRDHKRVTKAILASSAIPFVFPAEKIGRYHYLDAGILNLIPVEHAIRNDCDIIFVILGEPRGRIKLRGEYNTFIHLLSRLSKIYELHQSWRRILNEFNEDTLPQLILIEPSESYFGSSILPIRSRNFKILPGVIWSGYTATKKLIEDLRERNILNIPTN